MSRTVVLGVAAVSARQGLRRGSRPSPGLMMHQHRAVYQALASLLAEEAAAPPLPALPEKARACPPARAGTVQKQVRQPRLSA